MSSHAAVVDTDIDGEALLRLVQDDRAGAVVSFAGVVRNHDHGVAVTGIEYVAHPSAEEVLQEVVAEFAPRVHHIAVQHRIGWLDIGGVALYLAVSASHRKEAISCLDELIDEIKARLPIWKKQFLADGGHEWSQCP
ncbi:molybdenum cofactor biosynthesis protein MoaE [Arachnia propionica]|uniref:molybdenum cofactor biosynthesis protein MoaE n=1 Tax=Arachnia propionica TaxID=1750 RepID=UPI001639E4B8|nr:molybdenum cofactor biosynthesis protein MoaE [Arachnia propionica]MDO5082314.1 molybdenum cofactor biosynthesis protein MoaE [Arachnia propionica]